MIWLDNSRIIAVAAVVFLHVAGDVVLGSEIGSEYWWFGNIYDSLFRWCVPVLVMISGALLLDCNKKEDMHTFYLKRITRVLVPIIFWSVFFLLWQVLLGHLRGNEPAIIDLLKSLLSGKPYFHIWYLYMIMGLYLFTPFFRKLIASSTHRELTNLVLLLFLLAAANAAYMEFFSGYSKFFVNWFLLYIPFYFLGYLVRVDDRHLSRCKLWTVFLLSFLLTCIGCYFISKSYGLLAGRYFYSYLSVTVIPMSVSIIYIFKSYHGPFKSESLVRKLSVLTLGVYLIHPMIIDIINYVGYGAMSFHPLVSIPINAFIVLTASLGGAWVIRQIPYLKRII